MYIYIYIYGMYIYIYNMFIYVYIKGDVLATQIENILPT